MISQLVMVLNTIINLYCLLIFVWAILSWFITTKNKMVTDLYKALDKIVSPYVSLFRRFIKPMGGMDLSPIIALIALQLIARLLIMLFI